MTPSAVSRASLAGALVAAIAASAGAASAQERYRRPFDEGHRLNYGYDHQGGGGCDDYDCAGACYDGHEGSDFGNPFGTNVLAGADGTVSYVHDGCPNYGSVGNSCGSYCGNYVRIDHGDGSRTIYCHMRLGSIPVRIGDRVRCGQRIGQSASSGSSSGPHLHFGYRATTSSAYRDPFTGRCSAGASRWVTQRAYREPPGTACSCEPSAESCNGRDDDCDGAADEDDVCEIALLHAGAGGYAPPRTTDVDGDGRADVCARGADGAHCWLARETGWSEAERVVPLSDAAGWDDPANYTTLRMGDVDGDRRADLCARADDGVRCALSDGSGLGELLPWREDVTDANGWGSPRFYTTLRLADVDGDGRDDLCARDSAGFGCWLSDGTRFDRRIEGPRWSDELGWGAARFYGSIRMADLDGDGRDDVCARSSAGVACWLSDGEGFPTAFEGPEWSDERGWGASGYWSTMRLADVDGDGRADLCARNSFDLRCLLSSGTAFDRAVVLAELADAAGWSDVSNHATLRAGDVDGDGADDLCARADAGMRCWALHGDAVVEIAGPPWADDAGWSGPQHYETIRLSDFDGDGDADLCARSSAGWSCLASDGGAFDRAVALDAMRDDQAFAEPPYWSTILSGGGRSCAPIEIESCNARDDDCDGLVDEDGVCDAPDAAVPRGRDGGAAIPVDGSARAPVSAGCGCSVPGGRTGGGALALLLAGWLVGTRRRRRIALATSVALVVAAIAIVGCAPPPSDVGGDADAGRSDPTMDAAPAAADAGSPPTDARIDAYVAPACRGATQPCADDDGCCGELTCGSTMLGRVCCGEVGATCASAADCCGNIPCVGDRCMPMCRPARQACSGTECCTGLTCGTTSLGRTCCGQQLTPCSTSDGSDCCGALLCGNTSAGRVCCGGSGAACATADGRDCCGSLLCVGGRCS